MATYSTIKAAALDITIKRGDTQSIVLTFTDPDDANNPVDLSGYDEILMQIKQTASSVALIALTLGSGLTVSGASSNVLTIALTATQSEIASQTYMYDIEGTITATSFVRTLAGGSFKVDQDISNA